MDQYVNRFPFELSAYQCQPICPSLLFGWYRLAVGAKGKPFFLTDSNMLYIIISREKGLSLDFMVLVKNSRSALCGHMHMQLLEKFLDLVDWIMIT